MNGGMEPKTPVHNAVLHKAPKNYKLLIDPFLVKGVAKLYRYDGVVPGDNTYPSVQCRDPRSQLSRIWNKLEPADLPVPRYFFRLSPIIQAFSCKEICKIHLCTINIK